MQTAYLYIRVSTDEQALRGSSQRSQHERLLNYCLSREITVLNVIFEDHSAKTFDRPAWKAFLSEVKRHKAFRPDCVLFTKWDRFSRNAGDAYYMISRLQRLGICPQAIDQQLDLSVAENKILLAVYLATSEVENDRRSCNVRQGIHKAKQEGRWVAHVPIGYRYQLSHKRQKVMVPKEPEATFVRQAFTLITGNPLHIQSVYKQVVACGLRCSRSHFWRMIRNPVYCGKVIVPAYEGEQAYLVRGLHEPIVSEPLFNRVQDVLNRRKRQPVTRERPNGKLPLRGFVYCPNCHKKLTGSGSRGKAGRYYYYYHCATRSCGFRIRADLVNQSFQAALEKLTARKTYQQLYRDILKHVRKEQFAEQTIHQKSVAQHADRLIERILKAQQLMIQGELEIEDFELIKTTCKKQISLLGLEMQRAVSLAKGNQRKLTKAVLKLSTLGTFWQTADHMVKRKLLCLLLAGKPFLTTNGLRFNEIAGGAVQSVYGVPAARRNFDFSSQHESLSRLDHSLNQALLSRIVAYEKGTDIDFSMQAAQEILDFLANFALLATEEGS